MTELRVHPNRKIREAAEEAHKRGHWLEVRDGMVVEVIPKGQAKNFDPGPPPAA